MTNWKGENTGGTQAGTRYRIGLVLNNLEIFLDVRLKADDILAALVTK